MSGLVQVNCISTEFTPKKHGGEKGVPFRIQVETYSHADGTPKRLHVAGCQIKVFKVNISKLGVVVILCWPLFGIWTFPYLPFAPSSWKAPTASTSKTARRSTSGRFPNRKSISRRASAPSWPRYSLTSLRHWFSRSPRIFICNFIFNEFVWFLRIYWDFPVFIFRFFSDDFPVLFQIFVLISISHIISYMNFQNILDIWDFPAFALFFWDDVSGFMFYFLFYIFP